MEQHFSFLGKGWVKMASEIIKSAADLDTKVRYLGKAVVDIVTAETPKDWIKERTIGGGGKAFYVEGYHFVERLNEAFGLLWSARVKDWKITEQVDSKGIKRETQIVVLRELSIKIPGRTIVKEYADGTKETTVYNGFEIVKEQFGGQEVKRYAKDVINRKTGEKTYSKGDIIDLANDLKGAATDGLKKSCLELGMFNDIYSKRGGEEMGPTVQQLEALYFRGEGAGMDKDAVDTWVAEEVGKQVKDLEQIEVRGLISQLLDKAKGAK